MYDVVLQVAHTRTPPAYDFGYIWSPEVYGREAVSNLANMWWSLPSNKYNCWSCCTTSQEQIVDDAACFKPTGLSTTVNHCQPHLQSNWLASNI